MEQELTKAEQLYNEHRYEEALAIYEEAIRLSMPNPDPRLYYGRATVLERLAEQAYEMAKQSENKTDEQMEITPYTMNLADLERYAAQELVKYRRGESSDDRYFLEIYRRAVVQQDSAAWDMIVRMFSQLVPVWIKTHPYRDAALHIDSEENYVAQTFARLWTATSKQEVTFTSMSAFLKFLRACLHAALIDTLRTQVKSEQLSQPFPEVEDQSNAINVQEREFWEAIQTFLPIQREKQLAYLMYYCNLKPREIMKYYPNSFKNTQEIYRLHRSIMDRLMRNADQIRWRLSSEEFEPR